MPAFSQVFKIKGGVNFSTIIDDSNQELYQRKKGIKFGCALEFPINSSFSIEPGIMFSKKGAKFSETDYYYYGNEYDIEANLVLNYLEVPILFRTSFPVFNNNARFFVTIGPYIACSMDGKIRTKSSANNKELDIEEVLYIGNDKEDDDIKSYDIGLTIGGGYVFNKFEIALYINDGLSDITPDKPEVRNNIVTLSVALKV